MEYHQYQEQQHEESNPSSVADGSVGGNKSSFLCRQPGARRIPTSDQMRILRDLYYSMGIRPPTAEEIQKISASIRKYGKIEGKNVFYWFQNHKARERQKKRLTVGISSTTSTPSSSTITTMSPGVLPVWRRRRWVRNGENTLAWIYPYASVHEAESAMATREIETLPLFPIKQEHEGEEEMEQEGEFITRSHLNNCNSTTTSNNGNNQRFPADHHHLYGNHHRHLNGGSCGAIHQAGSLELSLNPYYHFPGST